MKKFMYFFLVIPVIFVGLVFTYWNNQSVILKFPYGQMDIYLPVLLVAVFAFGTIVGYVISFFSSIKIRRRLSVAKKELKRQDSSF